MDHDHASGSCHAMPLPLYVATIRYSSPPCNGSRTVSHLLFFTRPDVFTITHTDNITISSGTRTHRRTDPIPILPIASPSSGGDPGVLARVYMTRQ